jgi:hypothetical protein
MLQTFLCKNFAWLFACFIAFHCSTNLVGDEGCSSERHRPKIVVFDDVITF